MSESNETPADLTAEIDCGDLAPVEVPVKVGGEVRYFLREPSDDVVLKYQGWSLRTARIEDGKVTRTNLDGLLEAETNLVAACLCEAEGGRPRVVNGNVVPVPVALVKGWPGRVKKELYQRLVRIAPHVNPTPATRAEIEKQVKKLQADLKKLDDGGAGAEEPDAKKPPGAGTAAFA